MKCNAINCDKESTLSCPTCQKLKLDRQYSAFCSQECFKSSWKEHKKIHTAVAAAPTGDFTYVLIPADPSEGLLEQNASLAGGLENDEVQECAKKHFFGPEQNPMAFQLVDICTVYLPAAHNGYIGISLYSSGDAARPVNSRATEITQACGHQKTIIYGDAYISRCYDNEAEPWIRRDLLSPEVDVGAVWVREAALLNQNRDMDAYTSGGSVEKAMHQLAHGGAEGATAADEAAGIVAEDWEAKDSAAGEEGSKQSRRNQHNRWTKGKGGFYRPQNGTEVKR
jgi:hypothetical protein